jgi:perosamine synthetase
LAIPVCLPVVPRNAKKYVDAVIEKNWVSSLCLEEEVDFIGRLEREFSQFCGVRYGTTVTNGSTALDLTVAALDLPPGSEIIVPTFTMVATANAVIHNGHVPVFVDSDPNTWCINVAEIEKVLTKKTRAIIPVHIYGYPCDMDRIMEITGKHDLFMIEDAAEAIGTEYRGRKAGSFGDMACFSFYANKIITSGEGGIVVTDNEELHKRAAMLKNQGFGEVRFIHEEVGFNFRMSNLTAAYAYASFEEVTDNIRKRIRNAELYNQGLQDIEGIILAPKSQEGIRNSYWMYGILVDEKVYGRTKAEVRERLKSEFAIDTRDFFFPMHKQPAMIKHGYSTKGATMPVSERLWDQGFYLPSSTNLKRAEIEAVVDALHKLKN